jgi:Tol biopolymer transport system component
MRLALLPIVIVVLVGCGGAARVRQSETLVMPTGAAASIPGAGVAALSPDGRHLLYSSRAKDGAPSHLYICNADGTQPRQITNSACDDRDPAWSSDGRRIIFVRAARYRPYSMGGMVWDNMDVWMMNADGGNAAGVTHSNFYQAGSPHFSPDQRRVVFWAYRQAPSTAPAGQPGTSEVAIGELDEQGHVAVIRWMPASAGPDGSLYFGAINRDPCFSPDGTAIVFVSNRIGRVSPYDYEIWLTDAAFTKAVQLTHLQTVLASPTFTTDGRSILFTGEMDREGKTPLWRIKSDGSDETRLR